MQLNSFAGKTQFQYRYNLTVRIIKQDGMLGFKARHFCNFLFCWGDVEQELGKIQLICRIQPIGPTPIDRIDTQAIQMEFTIANSMKLFDQASNAEYFLLLRAGVF